MLSPLLVLPLLLLEIDWSSLPSSTPLPLRLLNDDVDSVVAVSVDAPAVGCSCPCLARKLLLSELVTSLPPPPSLLLLVLLLPLFNIWRLSS